MVDTFVVTQAINNMPTTSISCPLERTWHGYYRNKDATSIKAIQDALSCCGLGTVKQESWPFADGKDILPTTCATTFGRDTPCFGPWSKKHQLSAGMFMSLAIVTLMSKVFDCPPPERILVPPLTSQVIIFIVYRRRARNQPPATQRLIGPGTTNNSDNGAESGRSRIAGLRLRPDERTKYPVNDSDDIESVFDETSRLLEDNEDRNHQETSRLLGEGDRPVLPSGDDSIWRNEHSRTNPSRQGGS